MKSSKVKKSILRIAGALSGAAFILFGILYLFYPIFDTKLEIINAVCSILVGLIFIIYGVTGRSHILSKNDHETDV